MKTSSMRLEELVKVAAREQEAWLANLSLSKDFAALALIKAQLLERDHDVARQRIKWGLSGVAHNDLDDFIHTLCNTCAHPANR